MRPNLVLKFRIAAVVALLAVPAGCGGAVEVIAADDPAASESAASGTADLPSGILISTSVTQDDTPRPTTVGKPVRLRLGPGQTFGADDGCVSVQGTARPVDGTLDVTLNQYGGLCSAVGNKTGPGTQSAWLEEFFGAGPTYLWDDGELELRSGETVIMFVPREVVEPDVTLTATTWQITGRTYGLPRGSIPPPGVAGKSAMNPIGAPAELVLTGNLVRGTVGCVAFWGPASIRAGDVTFGKLEVDKSGCTGRERYLGVGPSGVLAILSGPVEYDVDHTDLTLTRPDGKRLSLRQHSGG